MAPLDQCSICQKTVGVLGASRIFCVGAQMEALTGESRRREDRGAEGVEGGRVWGGVSPPQPTKGSGGAS